MILRHHCDLSTVLLDLQNSTHVKVLVQKNFQIYGCNSTEIKDNYQTEQQQ